jgi:hypothetical protein
MKQYQLIMFLLFSPVAFSQKGAIQVVVKQNESLLNEPRFSYSVLLGKDTVRSCFQFFSHPFVLDALQPDTYKLSIKAIGSRSVTFDSLAVSAGKTVQVNLLYPGPCPYKEHSGIKPSCFDGHKDKIIPVVYGLPKSSTLKKAKKGKVYLGGCEITGCEPAYYCKIHKRLL